MAMDERPFPGGNLSDAVRVGDTVRRQTGPWTPSVHALLSHLEAAGFPAPRPRGIDDRGREILTFVEGETVTGWPDPFPEWIYAREAVVQAARLLRRYHDLTLDLVHSPGSTWRMTAPTAHEVICHNDWAPYNAVFGDRLPIAMLDWDMVGPGSRVWDLARAAFVWIPLYTGDTRFTVSEKGQRLRAFCEAYGLDDRRGLLDLLHDQLLFFADFAEREARAGHAGFSKLVSWGVPEGHRRDADALRTQQRALEDQLQ